MYNEIILLRKTNIMKTPRKNEVFRTLYYEILIGRMYLDFI